MSRSGVCVNFNMKHSLGWHEASSRQGCTWTARQSDVWLAIFFFAFMNPCLADQDVGQIALVHK
eukprot:1159864-Pelagomonas_calceolata.AAC.19